MKTGIYQIRNTITQDIYIGSSINIDNRWKRHKTDLNTGKHHSIILQRAWDKYSHNEFYFSIVEECSKECLIERENYYLELLQPKYNILRYAGSNLGIKYSEEVKSRMREAAIRTGRKPPIIKKPVVKLDYVTGNDLEEFESITSALASLGLSTISSSVINTVCEGKRNSAYGFKWRWLDKPKPEFKTTRATSLEVQNRNLIQQSSQY